MQEVDRSDDFVYVEFLTLFSSCSLQVLYASRDIAAGEELNDSYIELRQSTSQRRMELMQYYRFHCTCPGCGDDGPIQVGEMDLTSSSLPTPRTAHTRGPSANTDAFRLQAKRLDEAIMSLVEDGEEELALTSALELLSCLQHPVNIGWRERYLAEAHLNVYHIARSIAEGVSRQAARKYNDMAMSHLREAYRWNILLQGDMSEDSIATKKYLESS